MTKNIAIQSEHKSFVESLIENKDLFENKGINLHVSSEGALETECNILLIDTSVSFEAAKRGTNALICLVGDREPKNLKPDLFLKTPVRIGKIVDSLEALTNQSTYFKNLPEKIILFEGGVLTPKTGRCANKDGDTIILTEKECRFIGALYHKEQAGETRNNLLRDVWEYSEGVETHTLETHVYRMRKKLETLGLGQAIETIENGYRLKAS